MTDSAKDAVYRWFNGKEYERINFKTKASLVDEDESHRFIKDSERTTWNNKAEKTQATTNAAGLMSAADKTKLNGIAAGANAYVHPTTSGNKHIPSGGSSGQILRWSADGTAVWGADKDTTYTAATTSAAGLMSAADKTKLNGIAAGANAYTHPTTSGNKHIPSGGSSGQILRWSADGTAVWGADKDTTYAAATTSAAGLMSAADKSKLDNMASTIKSTVLSVFYPVGSIYMSTSSTNPAKFMGGTWIAWGSGRVPVGVDTTQSEFNTVSKTGGEKTHQLTINEMPNHAHRQRIAAQTGSLSGIRNGYSNEGNSNIYDENVYTEAVGGSGYHNNLQPYITCYMWKRTA